MFSRRKKIPFYDVCQEIPLKKLDKWRYLDMTTRVRLKSASWRILLVGFAFGALYCLIIGRLFQLTVMYYHGRDYTKPMGSSYALMRHNILDRNGVLLASSVPSTDLSVNPAIVKGDPKEVAHNIAQALNNVDEKDVYSAITSSAGFKYIKRKLSPAERNNINWLGYPFLSEFPGEYRTYPHRNLVAQILGGVDIDNVGIAGIEKAYDSQLVNSDVRLSLDISVQEMVHNALTQGLEKFKATAALALVMDINNGEILASVSLPDYNPNLPAKDMGKERFNQTTLGTYEFGSIFKLFNTALGLESKTITVDSIFDTSKPLKIGRKQITDYRGQARPLTVPEILIHSSNIGSAQIGLKIGWERQKEFLGRFGFYEKLPIPLPERGTTQYNKKAKWADMESATISYGYGISVTPLHLIAAVASLANGGIYRVPTFIKDGNKGQIETRVIDEKVSNIMRHLMWGVVNYELPSKSPVALYAVGGKTGSANLLDERGKYIEGKLRTTSVGVFPMTDPKYIVLVSYTDPKKVKETHMFNAAGWNAKATGLQIIGDIAPYLGVEPVENWEQPYYITKAFERSKAAKKGH